MLYSPSSFTVVWLAAMSSPPQKCAYTVGFMIQEMGKPSLRASFTEPVPSFTIQGLLMAAKSQYVRRSCASDWAVKAMAVSLKETLLFTSVHFRYFRRLLLSASFTFATRTNRTERLKRPPPPSSMKSRTIRVLCPDS